MTQKSSDANQKERQGLQLSVLGALFMALLGIAFAILTSSDAILMDGLFSLIGCVVGLLALRVAGMVMRPGDSNFPFGYAAYEPMLNLTKGLLMAFITLFAMVSAVMTLVEGGREVETGWASLYAAVASTGCLAIAGWQWRLSQHTDSPLLAVDAKNWLVDGMLSIGVLIAFGLAFLLRGSVYAAWIPYTDPFIVLLLVGVSLPIPAIVIRDNWNQLVGKAPAEEIRQLAEEGIREAFSDVTDIQTHLRVQQIGRLTYIQLYVLCGQQLLPSLDDLDRCRQDVCEALESEFPNLAMDVVFTRRPFWPAASVGVRSAFSVKETFSVKDTSSAEEACLLEETGTLDTAESSESPAKPMDVTAPPKPPIADAQKSDGRTPTPAADDPPDASPSNPPRPS